MSKEIKHVAIAFVVIVSLRLLAGCTPPRTEPLAVRPDGVSVVVSEWGSRDEAKTTCTEDNQPIILVRPYIAEDSQELRLALLHERIHVSDMLVNCKAVQARYKADPAVRLAMEMRAYCADSDARFKVEDSTYVYDRLYSLLKELYGADSAAVKCPWMPP